MTTDDKSEPRDDGLLPGDNTPQEGPLSRWSRLKGQARHTEQGSIDRNTPDHAHARPVDPPAERHPTDADMPPIESLNEHSDYSGFLSPEVSDELRRLALRKLFHLPEFNIKDGLDDYDEDFRTFEVLKDVITADMRFEMERNRELEGDQTQVSSSHEPPLTEHNDSDVHEVASAKHHTTNKASDATEDPVGDPDAPSGLSS